jgi:hypothetical protein
MKPGTLLICLYDDWTSAEVLLAAIDREFSQRGWNWRVLLIDDGSRLPRPAGFPGAGSSFSAVEIVVLRRNVGHQKAIATGLCHLCATRAGAPVVVMDGDGEDRPEDLVRLVEAAEASGEAAIIFAERTRRMEGALFRFLYLIYRLLHEGLTGYAIRFGNFSLIPAGLVPRLVVDPNLWLHYAATAVSGGVPYTTIPTSRGRRIAGESKLGFTGLVRHGLTALCCYDRLIGARLMAMGAVVGAATLLLAWGGDFGRGATWLRAGFVGLVGVDFLLVVLILIAFFVRRKKAHLAPPLQDYAGLIREVDRVS